MATSDHTSAKYIDGQCSSIHWISSLPSQWQRAVHQQHLAGAPGGNGIQNAVVLPLPHSGKCSHGTSSLHNKQHDEGHPTQKFSVICVKIHSALLYSPHHFLYRNSPPLPTNSIHVAIITTQLLDYRCACPDYESSSEFASMLCIIRFGGLHLFSRNCFSLGD